jgi:hypothetical protein
MRQLALLIGLTGAMLSPQATATKPITAIAKPTEFMGFTLGQRFDMPECAFEGRTYSFPEQPVTPCWEHYGLREDPGDPLDTTGSFKIRFMIDFHKIPSGVDITGLSFVIVNGSIEGIYTSTTGYKSQSSVLEKLVEKFGKPAKESSDDVQNLRGANLSKITAQWTLPDKSSVIFLGMVDSIDVGYISVLSPSGEKYLEDEAKKKKEESASF